MKLIFILGKIGFFQVVLFKLFCSNKVKTFRPDATLSEIAGLLKGTTRGAARKAAKFSFKMVNQNKRGRWHVKPLGTVDSINTSGGKKLQEFGFEAGDYLDVVIS